MRKEIKILMILNLIIILLVVSGAYIYNYIDLRNLRSQITAQAIAEINTNKSEREYPDLEINSKNSRENVEIILDYIDEENKYKTEKISDKKWASNVLDLIKSYNPSLQCYAINFSLETVIFCYFPENFIFYSQDKTKFEFPLKNQSTENKEKLRKFIERYIEIRGSGKILTFRDNEEFVNWAMGFLSD